jgi:fatty acid desaturase
MAHRRSLIPTLPTAIATLYSMLAHAGGLALLCRPRPLDVALGVSLVSHARVVAAVLVHDATHEAVVRRGLPNAVAGTLLLWLAGCPYCYFPRVQKVHVAHHRDRADTIDFDYRAFIGCRPMLKTFVLACETLFVPAVELLMHARCAFSPLLWPQSELHRLNSVVGIGAVAYLCSRLYEAGGCVAPLAWFVTTCILIHVLNYHDAFAHTYIVVDADAPGYRPGPMDRTATYEEENTYSTGARTKLCPLG